eukprot:RCo012529
MKPGESGAGEAAAESAHDEVVESIRDAQEAGGEASPKSIPETELASDFAGAPDPSGVEEDYDDPDAGQEEPESEKQREPDPKESCALDQECEHEDEQEQLEENNEEEGQEESTEVTQEYQKNEEEPEPGRDEDEEQGEEWKAGDEEENLEEPQHTAAELEGEGCSDLPHEGPKKSFREKFGEFPKKSRGRKKPMGASQVLSVPVPEPTPVSRSRKSGKPEASVSTEPPKLGSSGSLKASDSSPKSVSFAKKVSVCPPARIGGRKKDPSAAPAGAEQAALPERRRVSTAKLFVERCRTVYRVAVDSTQLAATLWRLWKLRSEVLCGLL